MAIWDVDTSDPPTAQSTSFEVLVTRRECAGGETGKVFEPVVDEGEDQVVVTFSVEPLPPGANTCPGNTAVPYVVELAAPVGTRTVVDGACLDDEASSTSFCIDPVRFRP